MTTPPRPASPRWSVALRVGVGVFAFGLFVLLFSSDSGPLGLFLLALGTALLLTAAVFALLDRSSRR